MTEPLKVGDLVEVPELRTVVRLRDVEEPGEAATLVSSFVLTEEVSRAFEILARSFAAPSGQGFFLIGSYGSGKSHLLAVISLWCEAGPGSALDARRPEQAPASPRKLLAVRTSLVEHRGAEPLEECVLRAAERRLDDLGRPIALTPARQHLERLAEALSGSEHARLDRHLEALGLPAFSELSRSNPREAVSRAREFMAEASIDLPSRLHDERPALFERLVAEARAAGYEGLVLLVDELSEFLRSKPSARLLSEDARFLQFLGELGRTLPLWVVASMQESLEETGDLSRAVLDKIKDRYPVRLRLTATHVEELISGRLVRLKPGAREKLDELHAELLRHLPGLGLSAERFRKLYPLHPATLAYLEGLSDLFSQARGVVSFVTGALRGDPLRGIPGLLEADAASLLGVDAIFDHFEARLREHEAYAPYYRKAYLHLKKRCQDLFGEPGERAIAERLVKLLVLTELNPLESRKSVRELTELLLVRISDLDPTLNCQYLSEAILAPLYSGSDYLRREPALQAGDPCGERYGLDLALDVRTLLKERVAARLNTTRGDETRLIRSLFRELGGGEVPLDRLAHGERVTLSLRWLNSDREGELWLGDPATLDPERLEAAQKRLDQDTTEFLIFLREPGQPDQALPAALRRPDVLLWRPRELSEAELAELVEAAAYRGLASEVRGATDEELRLKELIEEETARQTPGVRARLESLYLDGFVAPAVSSASLLPLEARAARRRLAEVVEPAVCRALSEAHPEFRRVMPQVEYVNPQALMQALGELSGSGQLTASQARDRKLLSVVEGVLMPLGLVTLKRGAYTLAPDESPGSLVHDLLARHASAERLDFQQVFLDLCKGPFGLTALLARTLLLGLVRTGHLVASRNERVVATQYVTYESLASIESLSLGRLLSRAAQEELVGSLQFLLKEKIPEFWGLKAQRDVWQGLVDFKTRMTARLERLAESRARYADVAALAGFDWERIEALAGPFAELCSSIHPSHDAHKGIEAVLETAARLELDPEALKSLDACARFFERDVERLLHVHDYLCDPALDALPERWGVEVRALRAALDELTELVAAGTWGALIESFEPFRESYRKAYAEAHTVQVSEAAYRDLEAVRRAPEVLALEALGLAETLSSPIDRARLERSLAAGLARRCRRDAAAELYTKPRCACGFKLGEVVEKPLAAELRSLARDGLAGYAAELSRPPARAKLLAHAAALEGSDRQSAGESLRRLVQALDRGAATSELMLACDRPTAQAVADALRGRVAVVERSLAALADRLAGRKLEASRLRELFEEWLSARSLEANTLIHVVEAPSTPAGAAHVEASARAAEAREPYSETDDGSTSEPPLAHGFRLWAVERGLAPDSVARDLQLGEAPDEPPALDRRRLGAALDGALGRDAGLRARLRVLLRFDRLDASSLARELLDEPLLERVRALALDRLLALVLAGETSARDLPDDGESALPVPAPGSRIDARSLYGLARRALIHLEGAPQAPELFEALIAIDALQVLAARDNVLEPTTERLLAGRAWQAEERACAGEPPEHAELPPASELFAHSERAVLFVIDGLRFDLWLALRPLFEQAFARKAVKEELRLAPAVSTTAAARSALFGIGVAEDLERFLAERDIGFVCAGERDHNRRPLAVALEGTERAHRVVWLNMVDDRLHASALSPWSLAEALASDLSVALMPQLARIPRRDRVVLTADHGFRQSPHWPRSKPRYVHGGPTLLERAVPYVELA